MSANRFYLNECLTQHQRVFLKGDEHHHLASVMRIRANEQVELVNGKGVLAQAHVALVEKQMTTLEILETKLEPPQTTWIGVAIPLMRPAKLEWVIEKGTELGADTFFLYVGDHSEKESLSKNQRERLENLKIAAMKQSDRLYLPSIEELPHLEAIFSKEGNFFFGDPRKDAGRLKGQAHDRIVWISGPEKGFSKREYELLEKKAVGVRINPNTLRAETAPIAALSILRQL